MQFWRLELILFDAHCDTIQKINDFGGHITENNFHIDLKRLQNLHSGYVQIFAAFVDKKNDILSPYMRCNELIDCYFKEIINSKGGIVHCNNSKDINNALMEGNISALLSIEGGEALDGDLKNLSYFYNRGV